MFINFTDSKNSDGPDQASADSIVAEEDMLRISGIDPEKVQFWGKPFQKLAGEAMRSYTEQIGNERRPHDPNREEVILITDEEDANAPADSDDYGSVDLDGSADPPATRSSHFFHNQDEEESEAECESTNLSVEHADIESSSHRT